VPGPDDPEDVEARRRDRDRVRAMLDLHEGRGQVTVLDDAGIERVLRATRRIAVIGASADPGRPSNAVFRHLLDSGFDCVPVNPSGIAVHGLPAYATLGEAVDATGPVDLVDVFRRPEACAEHAREAVAVGARCLWLQLGVVDWEAASIAAAAGLEVVMDRCTSIEVRRIGARG
jgi:predicted CoA-binding protein